MTIDFTKPVQTRDGQPVEIKFTDGRGNWPVIGYVGKEIDTRSWALDGTYSIGSSEDMFDLVNIPEKRVFKGWVNIYQDDIDGYPTKDECGRNRCSNCLATVPITIEYTVGEGLGE